MLIFLILGLLGIEVVRKWNGPDKKYDWRETFFMSVSLFTCSFGAAYFLITGASALFDITNPIPQMIMMSEFFVVMITSSSMIFIFPLIFTIWCKYLNDDEDTSYRMLFLITFLILVVGIMIGDFILEVIFNS
jgi:MFS family permease